VNTLFEKRLKFVLKCDLITAVNKSAEESKYEDKSEKHVNWCNCRCCSSVSFASTGVKNLCAEFADIDISIDGDRLYQTDFGENYINPFIVNGTTYRLGRFHKHLIKMFAGKTVLKRC